MTAERVVLINAFEVPEGDDEVFLESWEQARAYLSAQSGYLATRLHRSLSPNADFRYVNVALWASGQAFEAATSAAAFANERPAYPFHASLYEVVRTDER